MGEDMSGRKLLQVAEIWYLLSRADAAYEPTQLCDISGKFTRG